MLIQDILRVSLSQWTFVCHLCGETKTKNGPNQKCCHSCRARRDSEYHKARQNQNVGDQRACAKCAGLFVVDRGARSLCEKCRYKPGPAPTCVYCSREFPRTSNRQNYCADCRHFRVKKEKAAAFKRQMKDPIFRERKFKKTLKYQNRKYREDKVFNIHKRMRTGINASLRGNKKGRSWEGLVGYSVNHLMAHLERQFTEGMSWANRSDWHIDHILPLSMFRFATAEDPEFRAAWALTNLRPLWGPDNTQKWSRRTHLI